MAQSANNYKEQFIPEISITILPFVASMHIYCTIILILINGPLINILSAYEIFHNSLHDLLLLILS